MQHQLRDSEWKPDDENVPFDGGTSNQMSFFLIIKVSVSPADWPVFEKQRPENTGSVLSSDLIRDDHRLHHQMGDAGQSVLLQVQKDGT